MIRTSIPHEEICFAPLVNGSLKRRLSSYVFFFFLFKMRGGNTHSVADLYEKKKYRKQRKLQAEKHAIFFLYKNHDDRNVICYMRFVCYTNVCVTREKDDDISRLG